MPLSSAAFEYIRKMVKERSGVLLDADKAAPLESRLLDLARRLSLSTVDELVARLKAGTVPDLPQSLVEAAMPAETSFFRDLNPFEAFKESILPQLQAKRAGARTLSFWCAGCSSGQEAYSIAMLLRESSATLVGWTLRLIVSDISAELLARAQRGLYSQLEINRGLPATFLVKYFRREVMEWQIHEDIRRMIDFRQINLIEPWPSMPRMDVVFLRNVITHFDTETRKAVLAGIRQQMQPDGYILLGGAETTANLDDAFERSQFGKAGSYRSLVP